MKIARKAFTGIAKRKTVAGCLVILVMVVKPSKQTLNRSKKMGSLLITRYVRIPHADGSLYAVPPDADLDSYVMLSDILPTGTTPINRDMRSYLHLDTGLEVGVLCGKIQPGNNETASHLVPHHHQHPFQGNLWR